MSSTVSVTIADGIADVRLNRPEKHNALNLELFHALDELLLRLADEPGLRAVVVSGEGASFCAGIDIASLSANPEQLKTMHEMLRQCDERGANIYQRICLGWQRLPIPVIAALQGHCYGGGMQIALGCDIRLAAADAKLSIMEIRWGLIPDMGASVSARALLRYDTLLDLTLSGRVIEADEALSLGLVTRQVEQVQQSAMDLARTFAAQSPDAVRGAKQLFLQSRLASESEALALEAKIQGSLMGQPNQMEAVMAGMAGRKAVFKDSGH
ncbi:MAG: crotonase/enoyl-CoA hydratase family protein [Lysobacterales bacterium]